MLTVRRCWSGLPKRPLISTGHLNHNFLPAGSRARVYEKDGEARPDHGKDRLDRSILHRSSQVRRVSQKLARRGTRQGERGPRKDFRGECGLMRTGAACVEMSGGEEIHECGGGICEGKEVKATEDERFLRPEGLSYSSK
jgi:hypothetical protein